MIIDEVQGVPIDDLVYRRASGYWSDTPEGADIFLFGIGPIRMGDKRVFEPIGDEL